MNPLYKRSSSDTWKHQLQECLRVCASGLETRLVVSFSWEPWAPSAAVRPEEARVLRVRFNLAALRAASASGAQPFHAHLLCRFLAERVRLGERADSGAPGSYLSLLAQLEALEPLELGRWRPVCLPPLDWAGDWGRPRMFTPADTLCFLSALRGTGPVAVRRLPAEDAADLRRAAAVIRQLAGLPEIGYYGSDLPQSSVVRTLRKAQSLLDRQAACGEPPRILSGLCGPAGQLATPEQLLCRPDRRDPPRLGLALRLAALPGGGAPLLAGLLAQVPDLRRAAERYQARSVGLFTACRTARAPVLTDDLIAVNRVIACINGAAAIRGGPPASGTVHPMDI